MRNEISVYMKFLFVLFLSLLTSIGFANPYAYQVISYHAGTNAYSGYDNPSVALGAPSRTTPTWSGDGTQDVTPFSSPWSADQVVSIGASGYLIVKFDHKVIDNPSDVYWGIDLLVFGNACYEDKDYPNGVASGNIWSERGKIGVSQDGVNWYEITDVFADDEYPTCGYTDTSSAYGADGSNPADFTIPVDPSFEVTDGMTYSQIIAGYAGAGGGTGVDISSTGLSWIQYVKIYQDATDSWSTEIDAFADVVPEPTSLIMLFMMICCCLSHRKYDRKII